MTLSDGASRPLPRVACERWLDALARAGWSARAGCGGSGKRYVADDQDSERVAVSEALGRVAAAPVLARWPSPRTHCAAMDGIAVRAADLATAPPAVSAAEGDTEGRASGGAVRLPAGMFEWIDTGDPMPAGADTVVVRERLLPQADGSMIVAGPARHGAGSGPRAGGAAAKANVRVAGEDFTAGELLVPAGQRLRPGDLAAVAAGGHVTVTVARRPVVAIIPTGDEIRPAGAVPRRGDIIDTNSLMLAARCRQLGAVPVVSAVVPDDPDALAAELRRAAAGADLVLVIAGSSRGRGDHAAAVLAQVGGVAVAGVAVRPGHPALLGHAKRPTISHGQPADSAAVGAGRADRTHGEAVAAAPADHRAGIAPVIGLPGYPLATAVIFELFGAPMLTALTGQDLAACRASARLDRDWVSPVDVEDWVLVTLAPDAEGGLPLASPARRGAGSISQLARADAWWPIPGGKGTFTAGTQIEVIPISSGANGSGEGLGIIGDRSDYPLS